MDRGFFMRSSCAYYGFKSMAFKSKAQRRKFAQLLVEGKISDDVYEEWNRETGRKLLPERLHAKAKAKAKKTKKKKPSPAASRRRKR
jgi:hypothetical protein